MKPKKPFKETKLGQFLAVKAPHVLAGVGDLLPDRGLLGIVKNIIHKDPSIPPEDKLKFEELVREHEKEMFSLEVQDRTSARTRETEFVKAAGHVDYMQYFVGVIGLAVFVFMVWVVVYEDVQESNRDMLIHTLGLVEGVVLSIFGYYYGSSKGSSEKNKTLLNR